MLSDDLSISGWHGGTTGKLLDRYRRLPPEKPTIEQMSNYDVRVGKAVLYAQCVDRHGVAICWSLPGGDRVYDRQEAVRIAININKILGGEV